MRYSFASQLQGNSLEMQQQGCSIPVLHKPAVLGASQGMFCMPQLAQRQPTLFKGSHRLTVGTQAQQCLSFAQEGLDVAGAPLVVPA
jgi:hypothetical protein